MRPKCDRCDEVIAHQQKLQKENEALKKYQDYIYDYVQCTGNTDAKFLGLHLADALVQDHKKLKKENDELRELNKLLVDEIKAMKHPEYDPYKHEKEIASLRADLALAVKALEHYRDIHHMVENYNTVADETLNKLKSRAGE